MVLSFVVEIYRSRDCRESRWETIMYLTLDLVLLGCFRGPLQYSCLEDPRDRGAWWAAVYGVAQSRTQLKRLSSSSRGPTESTILLHIMKSGRRGLLLPVQLLYHDKVDLSRMSRFFWLFLVVARRRGDIRTTVYFGKNRRAASG